MSTPQNYSIFRYNPKRYKDLEYPDAFVDQPEGDEEQPGVLGTMARTPDSTKTQQAQPPIPLPTNSHIMTEVPQPQQPVTPTQQQQPVPTQPPPPDNLLPGNSHIGGGGVQTPPAQPVQTAPATPTPTNSHIETLPAPIPSQQPGRQENSGYRRNVIQPQSEQKPAATELPKNIIPTWNITKSMGFDGGGTPGSKLPPDHVMIDFKQKGYVDDKFKLKPGYHTKVGSSGYQDTIVDDQGNVVYQSPTITPYVPSPQVSQVKGADGITRDKATGQPMNGGNYRDTPSGPEYTYKDGKKVPITATPGSMAQPGVNIQPIPPGTPPSTPPATPQEQNTTQFKTGVTFDPRTGKYIDNATGEVLPTTVMPNGDKYFVPLPSNQPFVPTTQGEYIQQGPVPGKGATTPPSGGTIGQATQPPVNQQGIPEIPMPETKTEKEYAEEYFRTIREMFTLPERQKDREKGLKQASLFLALQNALTNAVNYGYADPGTPVIKTDNKYVFSALDENKRLRDLYHTETETYKKDLQQAGIRAMEMARASGASDKEMKFRKGIAEAEMAFRAAESDEERAFRAAQAEKLFGNQKEIMKLETARTKELNEDQTRLQKELERFRHGLVMAELAVKVTSEEKQALMKSLFESQKELNKDSFQVIDANNNTYSMPPAIYWDVARGVLAKMNEAYMDQLFTQDFNAQTNAIRLMVAQYWPTYFQVDAQGNWSRKGTTTNPNGTNWWEQTLPSSQGSGTTPKTNIWGEPIP